MKFIETFSNKNYSAARFIVHTHKKKFVGGKNWFTQRSIFGMMHPLKILIQFNNQNKKNELIINIENVAVKLFSTLFISNI